MNSRQVVFKNWREMYNTLCNGKDLYNSIVGKYVFVYNENGALCIYNLNKKEAINVAKNANGNTWSSVLGTGGYILDTMTLNKEESLKPSYDFCKENYEKRGWVCI
jgi:hypothetical protein